MWKVKLCNMVAGVQYNYLWMITSKNWLKRSVNINLKKKLLQFHLCRSLWQSLCLSLSRFPNKKISFWPQQVRRENISFIPIVTRLFKQHLRNIWNSIHEIVKQYWGWAKKPLFIKKTCMSVEVLMGNFCE